MIEPEAPHTAPTITQLLANSDRHDHLNWAALRRLEHAQRHQHPLLTDGTLDAWLQLWSAGLHSAIETHTPAEQHQANQLARAALRLSGHLHGHDIDLRNGRRVAAGDVLTVGTTTATGREAELPAGVLLHVTRIDNRTATLDIPTTGEQLELTVGTGLTRHLEHAYATSATPEQSRHHLRGVLRPSDGLSW
jgi:hypothetical protein